MTARELLLHVREIPPLFFIQHFVIDSGWIDYRALIEANVGIKRDRKYPESDLLVGNPQPTFLDVGYFYHAYVPI